MYIYITAGAHEKKLYLVNFFSWAPDYIPYSMYGQVQYMYMVIYYTPYSVYGQVQYMYGAIHVSILWSVYITPLTVCLVQYMYLSYGQCILHPLQCVWCNTCIYPMVSVYILHPISLSVYILRLLHPIHVSIL